jgi:hypothetical protein
MWSGPGTVRHGKPQAHALVRHIRRTYPQLRNLTAEYAWSGVSGETVHGMPQIGEISPGLWLVGGFGGQGLNTTAMAGEAVARAIVEGDRAWQMFTPFALVWAGGTAGRVAQQVSTWARRLRESLAYGLARQRDRKRRREEAAKAAAAAVAVTAPAVVPEPPPPEPASEPIADQIPEPVAAPIAEPVAAAPDPEPAVVAEEAMPEVPEGQSGGAAPAIPDAPADLPNLPAEAPVKPKRKRRKTLRAASAETLAGKSKNDGSD